MLARIKRFAQAFDVHVWLVAHPRQLQDWRGEAPNLYDVSGRWGARAMRRRARAPPAARPPPLPRLLAFRVRTCPTRGLLKPRPLRWRVAWPWPRPPAGPLAEQLGPWPPLHSRRLPAAPHPTPLSPAPTSSTRPTAASSSTAPSPPAPRARPTARSAAAGPQLATPRLSRFWCARCGTRRPAASVTRSCGTTAPLGVTRTPPARSSRPGAAGQTLRERRAAGWWPRAPCCLRVCAPLFVTSCAPRAVAAAICGWSRGLPCAAALLLRFAACQAHATSAAETPAAAHDRILMLTALQTTVLQGQDCSWQACTRLWPCAVWGATRAFQRRQLSGWQQGGADVVSHLCTSTHSSCTQDQQLSAADSPSSAHRGSSRVARCAGAAMRSRGATAARG